MPQLSQSSLELSELVLPAAKFAMRLQDRGRLCDGRLHANDHQQALCPGAAPQAAAYEAPSPAAGLAKSVLRLNISLLLHLS